jgi:hypothetical protein
MESSAFAQPDHAAGRHWPAAKGAQEQSVVLGDFQEIRSLRRELVQGCERYKTVVTSDWKQGDSAHPLKRLVLVHLPRRSGINRVQASKLNEGKVSRYLTTRTGIHFRPTYYLRLLCVSYIGQDEQQSGRHSIVSADDLE